LRRLQGRLRSRRGQVLALTAVGLVGICGIAGFAIDVSTWYQAQNKQQAIADAAATAGIAWLPSNPSQATSDAQAYAAKNGGSSGNTTVTYSTKYLPNDTMTVTTHTTAPTYFLKVLGRDSVDVSATAVARAEAVTSVYGAMPFTVSKTQPQLSDSGCPCFGQQTTLQLGKSGSGGFAILDIDGSQGNVQNSTLASWIVNGCTCSTTAPVWIYVNPGNSYSSGAVQTAMNSVIGKTMLFPVYDTIQGTGSNAQYHIIAFSAFQISSYNFSGNNGTITGSFVKATWRGAGSGGSGQYFGVTTDQLVG
jgi:Flp pilus assembly protein TadG